MDGTCQLTLSVDSQTAVVSSSSMSDSAQSMNSVTLGKSHGARSFSGCVYSMMIGDSELYLITDSTDGVNIGMCMSSKFTL
mgnify:FL=1